MKNRILLKICLIRQIWYHVRVLDGPFGDVGPFISEAQISISEKIVPRTCTRWPIPNIATTIDGARRTQKIIRPETQQEQIGIRPGYLFL